MRDGRSERLTAALIAAVVILCAGPRGWAQLTPGTPAPMTGGPTLPAEIYTAEPLTTDQQQAIDAFADHWVPILLSQGEAGVSGIVAARNRLQQPMLLPQTSRAFREYYSNAVARRFGSAMDSDDLVVRLNVTIVASRLMPTSEVIALITRGLNDQSPAVRYWAVKGINTPGPGGAIQPPPDAQQALLQQLDNLLAQEEAPEVLEQVFKAMVGLDAPGNNALDHVIATLNRRVQVHASEPTLTYRPETEGLQAAYSRVLVSIERGSGGNEQYRQLARAAAQYMDQLARHAANNPLPSELVNEYKRLAGLAYQILSQAHRDFSSTAQVFSPQQFNAALSGNNWNEILLAAQQFRNMLTNPPFNFDPTDVTPAAE